MDYFPETIEKKWQKFWNDRQSFKTDSFSSNSLNENIQKPKYYVLDMFPYPSGSGLHVGHPLGYIASDIVARYKRHQGFNVLHPMGYDSFGLPSEQYAIETGQHPAITTEKNIKRYHEQLDRIGFSFDWSREVKTSDEEYYKWTQWIFIQFFNSWYNKKKEKAEPIENLIRIFEFEGNFSVQAETSQTDFFSEKDWNCYSDKQKSDVLLNYRLAYLDEVEVNWCPDLGTVLSNNEVVNGVSERGGHGIIRKNMTQWMIRITAYAERLLIGLESIDWSNSIKEIQRNWIAKQKGALITFRIQNSKIGINVFTIRPDTIFGVTHLIVCPENPLILEITTYEQREEVEKYIKGAYKRKKKEWIEKSIKNNISGKFTGSYAIHPFTEELIPIWIGDYICATRCETEATMAVPAINDMDYKFAKHFNLPVKNIFNQDVFNHSFTDIEKENFILENSYFLNGLDYQTATENIIQAIEKKRCGKRQINYRLRDAVFSRQRYWGEPIPIYFKNGIPTSIPIESLPLVLPEIEKYLPTETGEPPLGRAEIWAWNEKENKVVSKKLIDKKYIFPLELNTMPGWAGSSWYFNRYMDSWNKNEPFSKYENDYWKQVDLYLGGSEHATGHLLYSRFFQKFLFDLGTVSYEEYAKKLINQGMILGNSAFVYRLQEYNLLISSNLAQKVLNNSIKEITTEIDSINLYLKNNCMSDKDNKSKFDFQKSTIVDIKSSLFPIHIDISLVNEVNNALNIEKLKNWRKDFKNAHFLCEEDGNFYVFRQVEKMSKSKYNVINPDNICQEFGADTLRIYEMFLGPIEQSKPWNTHGISGVFGFLKKFWKMYQVEKFKLNETPSEDALKIIHQTIKKVSEDIENFSFNTVVSTFMIAVNKLIHIQCFSREILEKLCILISPYAPHIAEELWFNLHPKKYLDKNYKGISYESYPRWEKKHLIEDTKKYPVSFNGKTRFTIELSLNLGKKQVEELILNHAKTKIYLHGKLIKNFIYIPGKIINLVF